MSGLRDIPDDVLEPGNWRRSWRMWRIPLSDSERERIAEHARRYRRRWSLRYEEMAIEMQTNPATYGAVERASQFASLRLLALVDRWDIERHPTRQSEKTNRVIALRDRHRERDRSHAAWISASRPESGPIYDRAAKAAEAVGMPFARPGPVKMLSDEVDPDPDIPFV